MSAPDSTTLPIPMSDPSPTVHPCTTALCPTDTSSPMTTGRPASTCTETLSWRLLPAPIVMDALSPRRTALYQTLASGPSETEPTMRAPGATKAEGSMTGRSPATVRTEHSEEIMGRG